MNAPSAKFPTGRIVGTPSALKVLTADDIHSGLLRHVSGDWGEISRDDRKENELSLEKGFRLLSVYHNADGIKFWIITEADRSSTCILLPGDY